MKKLMILLSIAFLAITSCTTENINSENQELGTYYVQDKYYETDNYTNSVITDCERSDIREFNSNGIYYFSFYVEVGSDCFQDNEENGGWEIENNMLKLTYQNEYFYYQILEKTNNELRLKYFSESLNTFVIVEYLK